MALMVLLLLLFFAGCGGDVKSSAENSHPASDEAGHLRGTLLALNDFPPETSVVSSIAEPCDRAIELLKRDDGETGASQVFDLAGTKVKESAGAYRTVSSATAAFFGLISEARDRCMKRAVAKLFPGGVEVNETRDLLGFGEAELWVRYDAARRGKPIASIDVVTMRMGRCVGEVLITNPGGRRFSVTHEASADASVLLTKHCPHVGHA